jgi:hypothetical protein
MEKKIDKATAEAEFSRYCSANGIDCNEEDMTEDDRKSFAPIKKRFIKVCQQGRVEVDGTSIVYTISDISPFAAGDRVTINRPTGRSGIVMDDFKEGQSLHKLQAFISAISGKEIAYFSKIDIEDWSFFRDIATLFLSV